MINESKTTALLSLLIALLGATPAMTAQLENEFRNTPLNIETFNDAVNSFSKKLSGSGFNYEQTKNILTRTLFVEGNNEGHVGREAIASVIYNRAGGNPKIFGDICLQRLQFSCWNKLEGRTPNTFKIRFSSGLRDARGRLIKDQQRIWNDCADIAEEMLNGTFSPTNAFNSYLNPETASKSARNSWGKKCTTFIGNHAFGYLPEWDGFKRNVLDKGKNTATVSLSTSSNIPKFVSIKSGDTLSGLSQKYNVSLKQIKRLNPQLKSLDDIQIGQRIILK